METARIPVPPRPVQEEIVAEIEKQFTRLDAGVEALHRLQAHLRRYRAAVLRAACEGRLLGSAKRARLEEVRSTHPGDQLPALPQGWDWVPLPDLGELNRGKSKHRPRDDPRLYGGKYPFIQTGDVKSSRGTITTHTQTYSELGLGQSRLWPPGTLCITIAANIAETGILAFPACFPDSVVGFLADDARASARYVEYFFRTAKADLSRYAPATAQKNINLETLRSLLVPLPPRSEQDQIVAEVERRFSAINMIEHAASTGERRASRLRSAILRSAFLGDLAPDHRPEAR
jgi:type I restriction enzyme S subunit